MRWLVAVLVLVLGMPVRALAQASAECAMRPETLASMRECYRPVLVFAPSGGDARLAAERDALDGAADDMMDRNVLLVPVPEAGVRGFEAPLDAPYVVLGAAEMAAARRRFGVAPGSFRVVLVGEDGGEKLRSSGVISVERLDAVIDSMPTRRVEMQRPHTN